MDIWSISIPTPLALAVVATIGYLVGRQKRAPENNLVDRSRRELRRAKGVARELEKIAWMVRRNLSRHHSSLSRFRQRVGQLSHQEQEAAWKDLCREASEMLTPTLRLTTQIADAYDQIRQQTDHLTAFAEVRGDPLTGISNRRAFDDAIASQFAMISRYKVCFSVAIFDIDHFKQVNDQRGHLQGDKILQKVARLLDESVRETDILARYGGDEFVVLMPHTELEGARGLAERLRNKVESETTITISGGIAEALDGDTPETIMDRAVRALCTGKDTGGNSIHCHWSDDVEPVLEMAGACHKSF